MSMMMKVEILDVLGDKPEERRFLCSERVKQEGLKKCGVHFIEHINAD